MTTPGPRSSPGLAWRVVNALTLPVLLVGNALAATGRLSGSSIGTIANRFGAAFLPADYVFSIWSLIYLGLAAFTVFQSLPGASASRARAALGPWWVVTSALNVAWISAFSFAWFGLAMVAMLALLGSLILVSERLRGLSRSGTLAEKACVAWPFSVYLAWISVALIANTFQYMHVVEWGGLGIPENTWAAAMMGVATLLGWVMVGARGLWAFPLVVGWAVWGIGVRFSRTPLLHGTAQVVVPLGVLVGLGLFFWRRRAAPAAPRASGA